MPDKKKYDFSDFDAEPAAAPAYDFSAFDGSSGGAPAAPAEPVPLPLAQTPPPADRPYAGILPRDVMNFVTSIGENIPVAGPAAVAAGENFGAFLLSKTKGIPHDKALELIRADNEARRAEKLEESPIAAGVAAPMAAAAMIPMPFANTAGKLGAAARIGSTAAISAADDLARGESGLTTGIDAGVAGTLQTLLEASPLFKKLGVRRATKAAIGQNKKAYKDGFRTNSLDRMGEDLLATDEVGGPVVGMLTDVADIASAAGKKRAAFGEKIGEISDFVDAAKPGSVSGQRIAERILDYAASLPDTEVNKPIIERLFREAENYASKGNFNFRQAQDFKGSYNFKATDSTTQVLGQDATNKVQSILRDEMEGTVNRLGAEIPELAGKAAAYKRYKGKYQSFKAAEKTATDRVLADQANRFASPSDYGMGIGAMIFAGMMGKGVQEAALYAAAGGAANKIMRERGSSFVATNAKFLGDLLDTNPRLFGKFKPELDAARARGNAALMVTHDALLGSPDYGRLIEAVANQFGGATNDTAVISDPAMIASYRQRIEDSEDMDSVQKASALSKLSKQGYYTVDLKPYSYDAPIVEAKAAGGTINLDGLIEKLGRYADDGAS